MSEAFNKGLLGFLTESVTPFHAVSAIESRLSKAGFKLLDEADQWGELAPGRYQVKRQGSIIGFVVGSDSDAGVRMIGAHTDSPCLKVKPIADVEASGYQQLGAQVYGGVLLAPWFDRDLSIAGQVVYRDTDGNIQQVLIDFERAIATVPSLAIHLDRDVNNNRAINKQKDMVPVLGVAGDTLSLRELLKAQIIAQYSDAQVDKVLDYDLSFYDTQTPAIIGLNDDFIASARLDNLLSCYIGLDALLNADTKRHSLLVCNDHEEVGSTSATGAQGPFLANVLERWFGDNLAVQIHQSSMISADNAHARHPNYPEKHEPSHTPVINGGVVIKIDANQRYATTAMTSSVFKHLSETAGQPVQEFVTRTDLACGSTIGPITSANIGVATLDVGVPTFGMHSIRELAGTFDAWSLAQTLRVYLDSPL